MPAPRRASGAAPAAPAPAPAPTIAPAPAASHAPAPAAPVLSLAVGVLVGSNAFASHIDIGSGRDAVPLGEVVAGAYQASGLSEQAWNELAQEKRDELLGVQVEVMRKEAKADDAEARAQRERAEQERLEQEREAVERAVAQEEERERRAEEAKGFPRRLLVSNNSGIAIVEPVSGAYIQAGGKATIVLTSLEHAHEVMENLKAVLEQNYLPATVLDIEALAG